MCTTGDKAHIDTTFKVLPHTSQHECFLLTQTLSFSKLFIPRKNGLVCRRFLCVLCTKCTLHSNHRLTPVIFQHTKLLSPGAYIFSLHTLASPSGRNVNYDEKQITEKIFLSCSFYLYRFRKYVSYGFPIINFCNPGVHYETPCIMCLGLYVPSLVHFRSINTFLPCCEVQYASTILLMDTVAL